MQRTIEINKCYLRDFWSDIDIDIFKTIIENQEKKYGEKVIDWNIHSRVFRNPKTKKIVKEKAYITMYFK